MLGNQCSPALETYQISEEERELNILVTYIESIKSTKRSGKFFLGEKWSKLFKESELSLEAE